MTGAMVHSLGLLVLQRGRYYCYCSNSLR